jgi:hypothetical protein
MTLDELAAVLGPLTDAALASTDEPNVTKLGIVLSAIMGAIEGGGDPDQEVIDALAIQAGLICQHRTGRHDS